MSKYDKFISDLNEEINNIQVKNVKPYVIKNYNEKKSPRFLGFNFKHLISLACCLLLIAIVIIIRLEKNKQENPVIEKPIIATSTSDAYAFEIMTAANYLYCEETLLNGTNLKIKSVNKELLDNVATKVNEHYLTIKQLLEKQGVEYKIESISNKNYDYKMIINSFYNENFDLKYTIYFNKTMIEKDDEEEKYNMDGIITIGDNTYNISGVTEVEDDETNSKMKIEINSNEYIIIEQEKEQDEEEYVYKKYQNDKIISEYSIEYEIEDKNVEIKIEMKENNKKEKIVAYQQKNNLIFKLDLLEYNGKVEITERNNIVIYNFLKEKVIVEKNILKSSKKLSIYQ